MVRKVLPGSLKEVRGDVIHLAGACPLVVEDVWVFGLLAEDAGKLFCPRCFPPKLSPLPPRPRVVRSDVTMCREKNRTLRQQEEERLVKLQIAWRRRHAGDNFEAARWRAVSARRTGYSSDLVSFVERLALLESVTDRGEVV